MTSIYEERVWLKSYPSGVPDTVEIPVKSVGEAFDEATEKWKNRTAVIFYGTKISYQELREKVDRFATALSDLGIKKGDVIAFLLLNSPEHIIAFYGAAKIGAIVTPISPVYVSSEIKHQLEDSGAEHIVCQDILYEGVGETGVRFKSVILTNIAESLPKMKKFMGKSILRGVYQKMAAPSPEIMTREGFHQFQDLVKKYPPSQPKVEIDPKEDVLAILYTGGTTGEPRGVMITHYNVMASRAQYKAFYPFFEDGKETTISYMPFYHAAGLAGMVSGIVQGSTSVIITTPDLDTILDTITTYKTSGFGGAPTIFEMLKDYEKTHRVNWKSLKFINSAADALHERTFMDWKARTGTVIHDLYGLTESTGLAAGTPRGKEKIGSVGVPLPNTMMGIADPDKDEFLPLGDTGEVVINGPQVTAGYWNNPEATKECQAIINGIEWWRTGDLGKMDEDGYFYLYDRKRDLIKYKGLRVHAREVEEVLKTHPQIKEAGVIGVRDIKVGEKVKAFVVLQPDARGKLSEEEVVQHCQGKLASYKIPKIIEFVGQIPKTDVGKVSRRELREMEEI
jgi:long-chain acyl-CoA synthetase